MSTDTGTYTIGQAAERSGFTASALRYYEDHGLLEPVARTDAGYRLYDDTSLARLTFIDRAKQLGCTLEEITDLAELWEADDCGPVQARLHELVSDKIADAQRRSTELLAFTAQLQTAAAHLGGEPVDGPCGDGCACFAESDGATEADGVAGTDGAAGSVTAGESVPVTLGEQADPAIACSLPAAEMPGRQEDWEALVDHVRDREPLADDVGVRLVFDPAVSVEEIARLAAAEQSCCRFFAFALTVDQRGIGLEIRGPDDAADLITAIFGTAA
ncbi:MAG: MerR family transcriptional regulator [Acidimicrobiales bacterium]|nr:MerR family transcriptional regulator [Acidimicrobiales bacterium]